MKWGRRHLFRFMTACETSFNVGGMGGGWIELQAALASIRCCEYVHWSAVCCGVSTVFYRRLTTSTHSRHQKSKLEVQPFKADTYYPYIRPVHTGCLYGPYVWVSKNAPLRTGRKYGSCLRAVCTGSAFIRCLHEAIVAAIGRMYDLGDRSPRRSPRVNSALMSHYTATR